MHLHDVSPSHLKTAADTPGYGAFLESAMKLTNSRYFDRMWVVLEYVQSKEATILSQYYDMFDKPAAELCDTVGENMGKYLSRLGQSRFNELTRAKNFQPSRRVLGRSADMEDAGSRAATHALGGGIHNRPEDLSRLSRLLLRAPLPLQSPPGRGEDQHHPVRRRIRLVSGVMLERPQERRLFAPIILASGLRKSRSESRLAARTLRDLPRPLGLRDVSPVRRFTPRSSTKARSSPS